MRLLALAFVAITLLVPSAASAQLARLDGRLDAPTHDQVQRIIHNAQARGLPSEPLVNKALEGALKEATGPRIVAAVAALAARLDLSSSELQPRPTEAELVAGSNALAVGVPPATLRRVRNLQGDRSVAVPLGVLSELVARGVPVERAANMVLTLLERGANARQLMAMSNSIYQDIASGIPADAAFEVRVRGVLSNLPPGPPAAAGVGTAEPPGRTPRPNP